MPRKAKQQPAQDMTATVDAGTLEQDTQVFDAENKRLAQIDAQFGDGLPYDPTRIINETRFYLGQSAEALLEAGKRIILLKEHEPHGGFLTALDQIGITPRAAQKMMQAAVKFSGANAPLTAHLGKTKLLELLSEDDEELAALADGGTLAGHTLDEIERMSAAELRAALRKERERREQDQEVNEKLLEQKNRKIDDLSKKLHERETQKVEWPQRVNEINIDTTTSAAAVLESLDQLDALRDTILGGDFGEADHEPAIEMMAVVYYDAMRQIVDRVAELMFACDEVFGGYKDKARPVLEQFLEQQKA